MKLLFLSAAAVLAIAASMGSIRPAAQPNPWHISHFENVLGTSMEIKVSASSEDDADRAENAAMCEIKRLNGILSGYDASSEFSRWSQTRGEAMHVSPDLMDILRLWDEWRARTGGALNPAAEAIARIWKHAQSTGKPPAESDLRAVVDAVRGPQWRIDPASGLATHLTNTPILLNSFTKSYIIERAAEDALDTPGVDAVVLNIGGDLVVRGEASELVNIADPRSDSENSNPIAVLKVRDSAVATSGNYRRGFDIGGRHFSHIVDPRTGHTAESIISATVVTRDAVDAGALATAFCVLSPDESRKLAASIPGLNYLLVRSDGVEISSAGWTALRAAPIHTSALAMPAAIPFAKAAAAASDSAQWNTAYELTIDLELPRPQGFGARRPYLAVWIEDKDRFPVRTLGLWFNKTRWLNELRAWYRDDRLRAMSEGNEILNSVSSATRSPGKYSFNWDGKDNAGKLVKASRYTVLVEAAREHGGYTLDRHTFDFNGQPSQAQLPADAELGIVSMDYHKAAR